jgi:hypothetical protein
MKPSQIIFIENGGTNAGDVYSSPRHYFPFPELDVQSMSYQKFRNTFQYLSNKIIVFGGGGVLDVNKQMSNLYKELPGNNIYIHWGSGSNTLNQKGVDWELSAEEINVTSDDLSKFLYVGRRDYLDYYKPNEFYVPCSSAMLSDLSNGFKTKRRIGRIKHSWLFQDLSVKKIPTISMNLDKLSLKKIIKFIGESEVVVTSSYHAAYWGLLMNKKVIVEKNWSSKFENLKYKPVFLESEMEEAIQKIVPVDPDYLVESRKLNINFYNKIINLVM